MADDMDSRSSQDGNHHQQLDHTMLGDTQPLPVNSNSQQRDSYWFAHSGVEESSANSQNSQKPLDPKDAQSQKEREERIKQFREQQEEERKKRMKEIEQSFLLSRKFREQQEEERKRKIEEARKKENERRQQVEERKRQIWEAEQERKEAILRRNLEREARIEARRNAQRNSLCFAFGSSTPRTFDLDLAALGNNSAVGCPLMSSVSGRRSEERDFGSKRATSACSLDRKGGDDCMSWSMTSLSSASRRRRRTDLIPVTPRERSSTPHTTPRGNPSLRAVSMTRLDQLAQPRRWYAETARDPRPTTTTDQCTISPSMSKSMCNLANTQQLSRKFPRPPKGSPSNMTRSMLHLPGSTPKYRPNSPLRASVSPNAMPCDGSNSLSKLRSAQSMTHLAIAPRLTRTAILRANALTGTWQEGRTTSMLNLSKGDAQVTGGRLLTGKNLTHSPSRPQSSMSGRSENSVTSSQASYVCLRPKVAPKKPRPVSIAGSTVDKTTWNSASSVDRKPRIYERNVAVSQARAKSTEPESVPKNTNSNRKPIPPPKSAQVLAKARSLPVPTKDNLRKNVKAIQNSKTEPEKPIVKEPSPSEVPAGDNVAPEPSTASKDENINLPTKEVDASAACINTETETEKPLPVSAPEVETKLEEPVQKAESPDAAAVVEEESKKENGSTTPSGKPKITSEDEARIALAEKRRIAREQAEREAELERQRQEELLRQEEERRRQEELEQKRQEEEQIRLAELHRKLEEEKLRKAIEEREQRENEERVRREEEARLKAEKEEQEKKAREEAERQRIELEERLQKEEQERAERKRRVEQIMSRTRGKGSPAANNSMGRDILSPSENNKETIQVAEQQKISEEAKLESSNLSGLLQNNINNNINNGIGNMNSAVSNNSSIPDLIENTGVSNSKEQNVNAYQVDSHVHNINVKNGFHADSLEQTLINSVSNVPKRTSNVDSAYMTQTTNGYSSYEDTSLISSPEEKSEKSDLSEGLLLDLQSSHSTENSVTKMQMQTGITQLIDIGLEGTTTTNSHNEAFMIDVVNSNLVSSNNPFLTYEDNIPKKQENTITDLLS